MNPGVLKRFTRLVGHELDAPVVCLALVDANRQLWTCSYGLPTPTAMLVSWSFVRQVVATGRQLVVPDARKHRVLAQNPVVRDGTVMAFVGMPLITSNGRVVGTLSVMDRKPRPWSVPRLDFLRSLSVRVSAGAYLVRASSQITPRNDGTQAARSIVLERG